MTRISAAESQVMEAVWSSGPLAADEIVAAVGVPQGWGEATVKTLINRLLKRKAIRSERIDGRVRYVPVLQRAGQFRPAYRHSETLRQRLGLPTAPNRYAEANR